MKKFKFLFLLFIALATAFVTMCVYNSTVSADNSITNIFTNPAEDCNNAMNISYHLPSGSSGSYVEYTEKSDTTWAKKKTAQPNKEEINTAFTKLNAIGSAVTKVAVNLTDLTPGTEYMYKVIYKGEESAVHYFKTGDMYFSFIWTSDFHNYKSGTRAAKSTANIEECLKINGGADFVLSTGDTIAHGGTYEYWTTWAQQSWINNFMSADTLGNHDWMTHTGTNVSDGASHIFWGANHNNPMNGYTGMEGICYFFYYGDALFVCLNTEEFSQAQYDWCEKVLKENDAKYKFIFQHYQMFNKAGSFCKTGYTRWHELCDKYGVDIAFSGNSHVYVRSKAIFEGALAPTGKGTVYMVAPSSDGDRGEDPCAITTNNDLLVMNWAGGSSQVANSIVNVTAEGIRVRLVNKGGQILDDGFIPAKRAETRVVKDLTGVDKDAIVKDMALDFENDDFTKPCFTYGTTAPDAVKSITIADKDTGSVYTNKKLDAKATSILVPELPLQKIMNLVITVKFYDNETKEFELPFTTCGEFGSMTNIRHTGYEGNNLLLGWDETFDTSVIGRIQVYCDDLQIETVTSGTKVSKIPLTKIKDKTDVTFTFKAMSTTNNLLATYTMDFKVPVLATSVDIVNTDVSDIMVREKLQLEYTVTPSNAVDPFEWVSDDETVARVNQNGLVVGISEGCATITCRSTVSRKIAVEVVITVLGGADNSKLVIAASQKELKVDETLKLEVETTEIDDTFTWKSSDESIATVDANGVVTALKAGSVKIGCYSNEQDDVFNTIELTVTAPKTGCNSGLKVEGSVMTQVMTYLVFGLSFGGFTLAIACRKRREE